MVDIRRIEKLIKLAKDNELAELKIQGDNEVIEISFNKLNQQFTLPHTNVIQSSVTAKGEQEIVAQEKDSTSHIVKSPMVGTVYLAAAPTAKNFVEVGQAVKVGDTLCLIEAMKMYNKIEADKTGVIKSRLVENGEPIEYNQPLFAIE